MSGGLSTAARGVQPPDTSSTHTVIGPRSSPHQIKLQRHWLANRLQHFSIADIARVLLQNSTNFRHAHSSLSESYTRTLVHNNNNNNKLICIAPHGRNFRGPSAALQNYSLRNGPNSPDRIITLDTVTLLFLSIFFTVLLLFNCDLAATVKRIM